MKESTTYDTLNGGVSSPLESQPVVVISKKGKRKINPLFEELVKNVPEETKRMVEKQMTCKWLQWGECGKGLPGTPCIVKGCVAWEYYEED